MSKRSKLAQQPPKEDVKTLLISSCPASVSEFDGDKVTRFPAQTAVSRPKTHVVMTPEMQMILSGLEQSLAVARRDVGFAEQRCNAYVVQCAETLNVNDKRYLFKPESRTFVDNPEFVPDEERQARQH